jgi:hypothetical protein
MSDQPKPETMTDVATELELSIADVLEAWGDENEYIEDRETLARRLAAKARGLLCPKPDAGTVEELAKALRDADMLRDGEDAGRPLVEDRGSAAAYRRMATVAIAHLGAPTEMVPLTEDELELVVRTWANSMSPTDVLESRKLLARLAAEAQRNKVARVPAATPTKLAKERCGTEKP